MADDNKLVKWTGEQKDWKGYSKQKRGYKLQCADTALQIDHMPLKITVALHTLEYQGKVPSTV